jgi:hypothetical protein
VTDEEINRKFDTVAGLIADVAVNQQKAGERMNRTDERVSRIERVLTLAIRAGQRERRQWRERHASLVDAQARTEEAQARTEAALTRLAEAQAHTDSRLDALIDIVREGRNGKSE